MTYRIAIPKGSLFGSLNYAAFVHDVGADWATWTVWADEAKKWPTQGEAETVLQGMRAKGVHGANVEPTSPRRTCECSKPQGDPGPSVCGFYYCTTCEGVVK